MTYEEFFETEDVTINDVHDIVLEHMLEVQRQYWTGEDSVKRGRFLGEIFESDEFTLFLIELYVDGHITFDNLKRRITQEICSNTQTYYSENMSANLKMLRYLKEKGVR